MTHDTSHSEPTRKDVLDIADYLGCNGDELWSEISKLLLRQDTYARIDENEWTSNKLTQDVKFTCCSITNPLHAQ